MRLTTIADYLEELFEPRPLDTTKHPNVIVHAKDPAQLDYDTEILLSTDLQNETTGWVAITDRDELEDLGQSFMDCDNPLTGFTDELVDFILDQLEIKED
jgi:hypothetical protein